MDPYFSDIQKCCSRKYGVVKPFCKNDSIYIERNIGIGFRNGKNIVVHSKSLSSIILYFNVHSLCMPFTFDVSVFLFFDIYIHNVAIHQFNRQRRLVTEYSNIQLFQILFSSSEHFPPSEFLIFSSSFINNKSTKQIAAFPFHSLHVTIHECCMERKKMV